MVESPRGPMIILSVSHMTGIGPMLEKSLFCFLEVEWYTYLHLTDCSHTTHYTLHTTCCRKEREEAV